MEQINETLDLLRVKINSKAFRLNEKEVLSLLLDKLYLQILLKLQNGQSNSTQEDSKEIKR